MRKTISNKDFKVGILIAITANLLFCILYMYSSWMSPMSGSYVFAWRTLGMFFSLWIITISIGSRKDFTRFILSLSKSLKRLSIMLIGTIIISSQLWLFMWGPINGEGLNIAMGYFLFPITMIIGSWIFCNEPINRIQWLALSFAGLGVIYALWGNNSFSWTTFWVCLTYPFYYLSRRQMTVPALMGLTFDLSIMAPVAFAYLLLKNDGFIILNSINKFWILVPLLGLMSAAAMQFSILSSRLLPIPIFSLFNYLEPFLLFLIAILFLNNPIDKNDIITYSLIWLSLAIIILDTFRKSKSHKENKK